MAKLYSPGGKGLFDQAQRLMQRGGCRWDKEGFFCIFCDKRFKFKGSAYHMRRHVLDQHGVDVCSLLPPKEHEIAEAINQIITEIHQHLLIPRLPLVNHEFWHRMKMKAPKVTHPILRNLRRDAIDAQMSLLCKLRAIFKRYPAPPRRKPKAAA